MSEKFGEKQAFNNPDAGGGNGGESTEHELSPEDMERVMEKVQDINAEGTVIHSLGGYTERSSYLHPNNLKKFHMGMLKSSLELGVVGVPSPWGDQPLSLSKEKLKHMHKLSIRQGRKVGPYVSEIAKGESLESKSYATKAVKTPDAIVLVLNKDIVGREDLNKAESPRPQSKYRLGQDSERLSLRLPPRLIEGVVIANPTPDIVLTDTENDVLLNRDKITDDIVDLNWEHWLEANASDSEEDGNSLRNKIQVQIKKREDVDQRLSYGLKQKIGNRTFNDNTKLQSMQREIMTIQQQVFQNNTEAQVPIYDQSGNLHWPKQMSHEEVKEFVAEREKKTKIPD